ncbi:MAG TPA: hypothetical protein P5108_02065 [Marmoricola sp.]|nr:hypothetical protein [Nocardioidaceae bacterium]MCB8992792.1 hypothetical protein [Nocardioidaceae bacterium]MCO5324762.1 hypothetical protein [Nocardioidaceae bacterium]HRV68211.1 hypothetical protein [Marmoricola sp.]
MLTSIGPAPDGGALDLDLDCFNGAIGAPGTKHPVTISPDWQVITPHDVEAERIAEAFGGATSCVTHLDRAVEAFRASLGLLSRAERVPLQAGRQGKWGLGRGCAVVGCCRGKSFGNLAAAARHTRSPAHLAKRHRVPQEHLEALLLAAAGTWGDWEASPRVDRHIRGLIREPGGVGDLWTAGIHPDQIPTLAAVASGVDEPLPVNFYLGLIYGGVDQDWVSEVLAQHPDPDTAAWLVWLDPPPKRASANAWAAWLNFGVSRTDVLTVIDAAISPEYVLETASSQGLPIRSVAAQLADWASADCVLRPEHFDVLKRHGFDTQWPSRRAIDSVNELVEQAVGAGPSGLLVAPDRTELAVMLKVLGNRYEVLAALQRGVQTTADLDAYLRGL